MNRPMRQRLSRLITLVIFVALLAASARIVVARPLDPGQQEPGQQLIEVTPLAPYQSQPTAGSSAFTYLPAIGSASVNSSPLGFENQLGKTREPKVLAYAEQLGARWLRLNVVTWKAIEPVPPVGGVHTYRWSDLAIVEQDILAANQARLTVVLGVKEHPAWAVVDPSKPCSAVRDDRLQDFAAFMSALVARYQGPPFNVRYWELGNEPDADPTLVSADAGYGCWGDIEDAYYGGAGYGRMLTVIGPAIRAADPEAKIVLGGLLLLRPSTPPSPRRGSPEKFLEGVLQVAGAADNFDILSYHAYTWYQLGAIDSDLNDPYWSSRGGTIAGKTAYVRNIMARYGVSKPLYIGESALLCGSGSSCNPPSAQFFSVQADHVARFLSRALANSVEMFSWYTLNGPGWFHTSLLDENQDPRPAYQAFQTFSAQVGSSTAPSLTAAYGSTVEAYRFPRRGAVTDVLWSRSTTVRTVSVPVAEFIAAYTRDGQPLTPVISSGQARLRVGFSPIYIARLAP